jgi:hypothetical protein
MKKEKYTILNIKGNLVMPDLDVSKFQDNGVIIYVEGTILNELKEDQNAEVTDYTVVKVSSPNKTFLPSEKL